MLPTLVGRKVRCTSCKNVFQLQYDGIAIKVGPSAPQQAEPAALEPHDKNKKPSGANLAAQREPVGGRQQTRAIRKKTERIKKIRSSLQSAAQDAISNVDAHKALDKKELAASGRSATPSDVSPNSTKVILTGSGTRDSQRQLRIKVIVI